MYNAIATLQFVAIYNDHNKYLKTNYNDHIKLPFPKVNYNDYSDNLVSDLKF